MKKIFILRKAGSKETENYLASKPGKTFEESTCNGYMMKLLGLIGQRLRNEFEKEYDNVIKYKPTQNTNLEEPRKMEGIKVYQLNSLTYKIVGHLKS